LGFNTLLITIYAAKLQLISLNTSNWYC